MKQLIKSEYIGDYKILLFYNDGSQRIINMCKHLEGEIFEPLLNKNIFQKFHIDPIFHSLEWCNGADVCPDFLIEQSIEVVKGVN